MPFQYQTGLWWGTAVLSTLLAVWALFHTSRFRVSRVNPAAARQTLKQFWRPPGRLKSVFGGRYRDSRVFLAAAILTLESIWGRVVPACYTGESFWVFLSSGGAEGPLLPPSLGSAAGFVLI
ncbi:hypothetical protein PoB_002726000 [Plakobranchus ocellatus]|uniref:Uncharacterized protein n=1 Tax=Plakobranchus ocellatus TaxID=259542 RepID=A0AAV3ZZZ1_9GAST|nr:hypothetical protein PoB_002726000 [Plakobranchus ocellatus]